MIVILTALQVEHEAVLDHLVEVSIHKHSHGTVFEVGHLASHPHRRIALGVTGPGAVGVAALTERAYAEFSPSAMLFVGIAGGLRDWLEIGDVVVATKVYAYQGGRSENSGFLARPGAWEVSHALEQLARRLPRDAGWCASLPNSGGKNVGPAVHFEAVAVGDVLLNSKTSPLARQIRRTYNDAVAIEMESSGFALAAHRLGKVPTATIRGISDRADGTKSATDGQGSQRLAARNAAAFAIALAAVADDDTDGEGGKTSGRPGPASPSIINNSNTVRDNARVGQQIGTNHGTVHSTWAGEQS
jgi:adenosylhomocysteine nucleosidase